MRRELVKLYAWAVPMPRVLDRFASHSPIVEVGAGGGYWALLLRGLGADVLALDEKPYENHWVERGWGGVEVGGPDDLKTIEGRALLLCWPPMREMAL